MRLVSFNSPSGPAWGVLARGGVIPSEKIDSSLPTSLLEFLRDTAAWEHIVKNWSNLTSGITPIPQGEFTLLPCVPHPGKVICLGVNYIDHAKEGGNQVGDYPAVFLRCSTSLLAHGANLVVPKASNKLDFEAELAVIIGRTAHRIDPARALEHVFGYACFNDATLRDYQRRTSQWTIGKNFDSTGAFGPCLVSADELPAGASGLQIESRLNGHVMQIANTADMVFGVERTISLLSESMTLEPGDVIVMGTPGGVGYARTPPVWMKNGDVIEIEIESIGTLTNQVID